jgi:hypothetical protein
MHQGPTRGEDPVYRARMRDWQERHLFRLAVLVVLAATLGGGCRARPAEMSAPARKACEDNLSQRLGGFPGFPSEDPRNESTPITLPEGQAPAYRLRGVVAADGIRGIYDCEVVSPDSGRTWKVLDLKFNLVAPEPLP